jgi:uncharacterized protein (TIGR02270 family)
MDGIEYLGQVETLWNIRDAGTRAVNIRLVDLSRLDERIDAFVDAAGVFGAGITPTGEASDAIASVSLLFARASLALLHTSLHELITVVVDGQQGAEDQSSCDTVQGLCAALSWVPAVVANKAIAELLVLGAPCARAAAIATFGTRRSDPRLLLAPTLADPSSLIRARAYRTTGQLGRADLMAQLRTGLTDPDHECRFWSAWAAARMGATEPLDTLADIAWNNLARADRALDLLLRRLDVPQAKAWLREFAKLPDRRRDLIRATGVVGDPHYVPWLIEHMAEPATARLAGESFSMITGLDLAYRDLDRRPPADFQSGPNDDPADENVALDEDENLPWPDPERIGPWWTANRSRFIVGTPYFLGTPKATADWLQALSDAFQRQRHAAALELAIRQPDKAMFEVRARGRLQRQLIARARGLA